MLSFGLLIACNLLVERISSLSGPATRGNLRTPEGEAGEEEWRTEEAKGSRQIKGAGHEGERDEERIGKSKGEVG